MLITAIDPGTTEGAFVILDSNGLPCRFGKHANQFLLDRLGEWAHACPGAVLVTEMFASFGFAVGASVFQTCTWIGAFEERWRANGGRCERMLRKTAVSHLCGSVRNGDPKVRAALIRRFGPSEREAIGTKRAPGPLRGVTGDVWSALAVACTFMDRQRLGRVAA